MEAFPHLYEVQIKMKDGVNLSSTDQAPELKVGPPPQFGGDGTVWSPEGLLLSSLAECLRLSFVAIARANGFQFSEYESTIQGTLDRIDRKTSFTQAKIEVSLSCSDKDKAQKLLEKAEQSCLISNSVNFPLSLTMKIEDESKP